MHPLKMELFTKDQLENRIRKFELSLGCDDLDSDEYNETQLELLEMEEMSARKFS